MYFQTKTVTRIILQKTLICGSQPRETMFNLILKRRGPLFAVLRRHVVKRHVNTAALGSVHLTQSWAHRTTKLNNYRKYSILPEPVEAPKFGPVFRSNEDSFAYSILQRNEAYSISIAKSFAELNPRDLSSAEVDHYVSRSWKAQPISDIVEAFVHVSNYAMKNEESIVDDKYWKFLRYLAANCHQFTDDEMSAVLRSLAVWPVTCNRDDERFNHLWKALDQDCHRRAHLWKFDELLLFCDHWNRMRLTRWSDTVAYVIRKLATKSSRMTPANLVQYMFYSNTSRSTAKDVYNLEYRLETCVDDLDIDELAVISMGFFKSKTPIRNSTLLHKITQRIISEIDTVHEISYSAIVKIIRYSWTFQTTHGLVWELLSSTVPQVPRLSLKALIHTVTTSVKLRVFHPQLLTSVAQRFNTDIKDARMKDIERFVLSLTCFNFTPDIQPNVFDTIVKELQSPDRLDELNRYQKSLTSCLQYLAVMNRYPKDLIALVLDSQNLNKTYVQFPFNTNQAVLSVDLNIEAEVPDYEGPRLDQRSRSILAKHNINSSPLGRVVKPTARHNFFNEILGTCEEIFGSTRNLHIDWVLPQYKEADIIMCLDKKNSPLPVEPILSQIKLGNVKKRPENSPEGSRWVALVIGAVNCYIRDTPHLLGKDAIKFRQLQSIGYTPVLIPWFEWYSSEVNRTEYLKRKLFE